MATIKTAKQQLWPEGTYPAKVKDWEKTSSTYGEQWKISVKAKGPDGESADLFCWAKYYDETKPTQKAGRIMEAVLGRKINWGDEDVDTDEFMGRPCRVKVGVKEIKDDEDRVTGKVNCVDEILPAADPATTRVEQAVASTFGADAVPAPTDADAPPEPELQPDLFADA